METWLAATTAILLISLCGVLGVLVIPVMQKVFYQHLLQFLIAMAVGTLTGDALLHLLPHALLAVHQVQIPLLLQFRFAIVLYWWWATAQLGQGWK